MNKRPWQFSMGQMFAGVAFLATAIRLFLLLLDTRFDGGAMPLVLYFSVFAIGGAGIGCFTESPRKGAVYGALSGVFLGVLIAFFAPTVQTARE